MDLRLTWHKPVPLRISRRDTGLIYELDSNRVPAEAGVYIIMRKFGTSLSPLYVGKARNLRVRINQQLNALKLMRGVQNAAIGRRVVVFGEFIARSGQNAERCVGLIETALIRHFLSEGHELLNKAGVRIPTRHSLTSHKVVSRFVPTRIRF